MYKLFLAGHYLFERRIAYFAIAAVTLCTALVLVQLSVMGGWLEQIKVRARGLLGDVIVDNGTVEGMPLYQELIDEISLWPEIEKATPVIYSFGLLRIESPARVRTAPVQIVGLRLEEAYEVNAFKKSLFYEHYFPGMTTLGPQQQPTLGFDTSAAEERSGRLVAPYILPEPYQRAWEQVRADARAADRPEPDPAAEELDSEDTREHREQGWPPIPGRYSPNPNPESLGPEMTGEPFPGLILGRDIVARRGDDGRYERLYYRGRMVTLTYWAVSARGQTDPIPRRQPFRYADDSRTGVWEIDSRHVYCDFDLLQQLLFMNSGERVDAEGRTIGSTPARCSQIQIRTHPGLSRAALAELTERIIAAYRQLADTQGERLDGAERRLIAQAEALTWEQSQAHVIAPVQKEKILVTILFGIISLVAVALVLCILYMIVLQKTRDIGIIKSLGGSSGGVAAIFVIYGGAVGLVGSLLGTTFGLVFVWYINDVQDFLVAINPAWRVWDMKVYSFDRIPREVSPADVVVVAGVAIIAATVGSLAAAWRAGSMQPVESLRYE